MSSSSEDAALSAAVTSRSSAEIVETFLGALSGPDPATAVDLVADDLVYENVSMPTVRGKRAFAAGLQKCERINLGFEVRIHRIAQQGPCVLTERTDALTRGRFRAQFWVCGVFEVHDDVITLWRDYFDWANVSIGCLRGLAGLVVPGLRASFAT